MTYNNSELSKRNAAITSGMAIVAMAITAGFAYGYVFNSLIVPGDAGATVTNLMASETLFRAGVFGWLVILILDVIVAWGLYLFFETTNKSLSLLTAWLRLSYAAMLGAGLACLAVVLLLLGGDYLTAFDTAQLSALVLLLLNAFDGVWSMGLVVFGCHLMLLGYLAFKAYYVPSIWGILLVIAAAGYLIVHLANLLLPAYAAYTELIEMVLMIPMAVGELGLGIWLWYSGGKKLADVA